MPAAIDAEELVQLTREEVQLFGLSPLVDGFEADISARAEATRVLPSINKAYKQLAEHFYALQYFTKSLVPGQNGYLLPETDYTDVDAEGEPADYEGVPFGFVEEAFLVHPTTEKIYPLEITTNAQENAANGNRHSARARRPFAISFAGDYISFDTAPDIAYSLRLLVDTIPDPLVMRTDKPKRLPYMLHEGIAIGAAIYLGRKSLAMPAGQSIPEGRFLRYRELKEEWNGRWIPLAKELANSRAIHASHSPLVSGIRGDWRRGF